MQRTHTCGELREEDTGQEVELIGWAQRIRDHGSKKFIDLRDREGITQIVLDTEETETFTEADEIGKEYLIRISGKVEKRLEGTENEELETGYIEVHATDYEIVSDSELPPFSLDEEKREKIKESLRFKHRYLDLRNRAKQENIIHRHRFFQALRRFLSEEDYIEVETPFLTKSTPEGARDFIVPSRNFPGNLYALPQSPQLFKQLLMVAGFEKYFQIVKCFRDEDTRSDRQPEFTQLDIEVSFRDQDEFLEKIEEMVKYALKETYDEDIDIPFRRMRYEEAMDRYGSDRPDLRFEMQLHDISEIVEDSDFGIFSDTVEDGGVVKAVRLEEENLSNNYIKKLETAVKDEGAPGLLRIEVGDELEGPMLKHIEEDILESIVDEMEAEKGDTIFMVAGEKEIVNPALGRLRRKLGEDFELYDDESLEFVWIMDFPMFGLDGEGLKSEHHPFTAPFDPEKFMNTDEGEKDKFAKMDADAYDLVLNGYEIGGGSKRIHDMEMQRKVFRLLELNDEEVEDRFGWFLEAFNYSAPPHRGIAFGLDRILMIMEDEENIREVIPFPKS
ncbi:MAG: aspartate--tRNA ligase, partial [Candidatus Aenigmatarchaeota archaeon]